MKILYITLATLSFIMMQACAAKKVEKPAPEKITKVAGKKHLDLSKINYPQKIGDYELQSKKSLKNKSQGIMIRYVDYKHSKAYLDCYIYPQEQDLATHYQDNFSALAFMQKKGVLKRFKTLVEDSVALDATHTAKRAFFEMENQNVAYYSALYLAPFEDHYFRVRASYPLRSEFLNSDHGEKIVKELFNSIKFNP